MDGIPARHEAVSGRCAEMIDVVVGQYGALRSEVSQGWRVDAAGECVGEWHVVPAQVIGDDPHDVWWG